LLADVIKSIRETEEKGEETRRNAQAESRRIIQQAEQQAVDLVRLGLAEGETKRREILAIAEQEAQQGTIPIQQRATADVEQLRAGVQLKQEEAIKMVMERIMMTNGHS
jgi:V/A-type H+/Na+-transporting ATPase subunit G/H